MTNKKLEIFIDPKATNSKEEWLALEQFLKIYFSDDKRWAHFKSLDYFEDQKHILLIRTDERELSALLDADIKWDWVHITFYWINETLRVKDDIDFLALCCRTIFESTDAIGIKVETQIVSLKNFYVAAGFNLIAEIEDYPPDLTTYILVKRKF